MRDRYEILDQKMIINDHELKLVIESSFLLSHLPHESAFGKSSDNLIIERSEMGILQKAFYVADGRKHGQMKSYYPDGSIKQACFYQNGQMHGPSCFYAEGGKVLSDAWFFDGAQIGKHHLYYPSGKKYCIQRFIEGKLQGVQEYFYEDGALKTIMHYKDGKLHGEVKLFWENGTIKRHCFFKEGMKEGWDKLWNSHGVLIDEGEYSDGKATCLHRRFFENGKHREEIKYLNNARHERKEWDEAGKLIFEGYYKNVTDYIETKWNEQRQAMEKRQGYWDGEKLRWR